MTETEEVTVGKRTYQIRTNVLWGEILEAEKASLVKAEQGGKEVDMRRFERKRVNIYLADPRKVGDIEITEENIQDLLPHKHAQRILRKGDLANGVGYLADPELMESLKRELKDEIAEELGFDSYSALCAHLNTKD